VAVCAGDPDLSFRQACRFIDKMYVVDVIVPSSLHHEVATVRDGRPSPCTGQDGKWSVAMCLATQMSVKTGRRVAMKEIL